MLAFTVGWRSPWGEETPSRNWLGGTVPVLARVKHNLNTETDLKTGLSLT